MDLFSKLINKKCIPPLEALRGPFVVDDIVGVSVLISSYFKKKDDKYLVVAHNLYNAQNIYNLLCSLIGKENVLLFPVDELVRAETLAQSKEMVAQRLFVLNEIRKNNAKIIVTSLNGITRYLPNPEVFDNSTFRFEVGKRYDLTKIKVDLVKAGYLKVNKVDGSLQFAIRGDILDIYSVNYDNPIRIEFFDDQIESIRFFNISEQTSISRIDIVEILPSSDILFSSKEISEAIPKIKSKMDEYTGKLSIYQQENMDFFVNSLIDKLVENNIDQSFYKYYSFISDNVCSLLDYCKDFKTFIIDKEQVQNAYELYKAESWHYLSDLFDEGKTIGGLSIGFDYKNLLTIHKDLFISSSFQSSIEDTYIDIKPIPFISTKRSDALDIIRGYYNDSYQILICLDSKEHIYLLEEMLDSFDMPYEKCEGVNLPNKKQIGISLYSLPCGFVVNKEKFVVLTAKELFNIKTKSLAYSDKFKEGSIIHSFEELSPGDYVVHEYEGIGKFVKLETLPINGQNKDFLKLIYRNDEILYVPLSQFHLVRKYIGKEGYVPRLSKLHGKDWEKAKAKIRERISDLAQKLMDLYIERSKIKGFKFQKDDEIQEQFEKDFLYELTDDQERSLREIKEDMESDIPMDRLLCGDVGFGKTEIAFRAAFKAILSGKQVAFLCPTTILARQHFELAKTRFAPYGVNVGMLSRLTSKKDEKKYLEEVNNGKLHFLIGTHRILSKDVNYNDLGLLIIDEEQRFGVEQKEKIKLIKNNIDVLTISATPIPRTLQMSLLNVRSLSQINTAPRERMPIQTYVTPFKWDTVKELISRELARNGQVFFLHNEVFDIYQVASQLMNLLPNAVVGVAHGQMSKKEIEDVIIRFYNGEIDVLVSTSIIENGIDVPNANMIIVQDSHKYGLSQLYQIKGRVGRSDRIAYAYLMYPEYKKLTDNSRKRLKALQEFTELGSGYKIAQRDLLIRGAGDVLGPEQAGFIDNIGLDMYLKLLNESVQEKLTGQERKETPIPLFSNLSGEAYIPSSYASDFDKIELYQEINSCDTSDMIVVCKHKMEDIYGKIPPEVQLLFKKRMVDILINEADVKEIKEFDKFVEIIIDSNFSTIRGIGNIMVETLLPFVSFTKISYQNKSFFITMTKRSKWIDDLINLLKSLASIYKINKVS